MAIIGDDKCYCTSYSTHDVVLELFENSLDNPCDDNITMDCGSSAYVSIYHVHEEFGHNFGYKFWQAVQFPTFNDYRVMLKETPHETKITNSSSECLSFCKMNGEFEIAIFRYIKFGFDEGETGFECFCMYPQFYKFSMQDIASETNHIYKHWCPDLDGPCAHHEADNEYKHAVVYCMDDNLCNAENFILEPTKFDICVLGNKIGHPKEKLSEVYYECTKEEYEIHSYYKRNECKDGELFYPNISTCLEKCTVGDFKGNCTQNYYECILDDEGLDVWIEKECDQDELFNEVLEKCTKTCLDENCNSNTTHCRCKDDIGIIWEVEKNTTGIKSCELYQENLTG